MSTWNRGASPKPSRRRSCSVATTASASRSYVASSRMRLRMVGTSEAAALRMWSMAPASSRGAAWNASYDERDRNDDRLPDRGARGQVAPGEAHFDGELKVVEL